MSKTLIEEIEDIIFNELLISESSKSNNWLNIGVIKDASPFGGNAFIMVNPKGEKTSNFGEFTFRNVAYNSKPDGSGEDFDIPSYKMRNIQIYPEYQDSYYGEVFLGRKKTSEESKMSHNLFLNSLDMRNNEVYLKHDSDYKITDGVIKVGKKNAWSSDSDIAGTYFWGSKKIGRDQSNGRHYTYFCKVPLQDIYDFNTNEKRYQDVQHAMRTEKYVGVKWQDEQDVIVVATNLETPIHLIRDNSTGQWYTKNWILLKF